MECILIVECISAHEYIDHDTTDRLPFAIRTFAFTPARSHRSHEDDNDVEYTSLCDLPNSTASIRVSMVHLPVTIFVRQTMHSTVLCVNVGVHFACDWLCGWFDGLSAVWLV